jgi:hypothetical protein
MLKWLAWIPLGRHRPLLGGRAYVIQKYCRSPPVVQGPGLVDVPVTKPISGGAVASIKDAELHTDRRIRSL